MRYTTLLLSGLLAAVANAQTETTTTTPTTLATVTSASVDPAQTSEQAEILACINACPAGDVSCTSKCIAVPNPDTTAVNNTNQCVTDCPKGNGTASDNLNYQNCVAGCIGQYYFTTSGTPQGTGGAGSGPGSTGGAANPTGSGSNPSGSGTAANTGSGSPTGTGAPAANTSKAAGDVIRVAGSAVGLMGMVAAFLAI